LSRKTLKYISDKHNNEKQTENKPIRTIYELEINKCKLFSLIISKKLADKAKRVQNTTIPTELIIPGKIITNRHPKADPDKLTA
jgi:hypothetical protein